MPMYDFRCDRCSHDFEAFVRSTVIPECPKCKAAQVTRQLSGFAVGASSSNASGGSYLGRARAGGGFGCGTNCACQ